MFRSESYQQIMQYLMDNGSISGKFVNSVSWSSVARQLTQTDKRLGLPQTHLIAFVVTTLIGVFLTIPMFMFYIKRQYAVFLWAVYAPIHLFCVIIVCMFYVPCGYFTGKFSTYATPLLEKLNLSAIWNMLCAPVFCTGTAAVGFYNHKPANAAAYTSMKRAQADEDKKEKARLKDFRIQFWKLCTFLYTTLSDFYTTGASRAYTQIFYVLVYSCIVLDYIMAVVTYFVLFTENIWLFMVTTAFVGWWIFQDARWSNRLIGMLKPSNAVPRNKWFFVVLFVLPVLSVFWCKMPYFTQYWVSPFPVSLLPVRPYAMYPGTISNIVHCSHEFARFGFGLNTGFYTLPLHAVGVVVVYIYATVTAERN